MAICLRPNAVPVAYPIAKTSCKNATGLAPVQLYIQKTEGELQPTTLMNEYRTVLNPEREQDTSKIARGKAVLWLSRVDHETYCSQSLLYPLKG